MWIHRLVDLPKPRITTLEGDGYHWCANGTTSIYLPTPTGFRIYLRWTDDDGHYGQLNPLRVDTAQKYNWYIKWSAIQTCPCDKKGSEPKE